VGIAALTCFSEREVPEKVTFDDLEAFARYAEDAFFTPLLRSYVSVLFTMNSFMNPAWKPDRQRIEAAKLLRAHTFEADPRGEVCAYCGRPSVHRLYRDMVPMLTGRGIPNFFPQGSSGLPVCGTCTVAILALAIGAPMCSGRALVIEPEDRRLLLKLTARWLPRLRERVQLSAQTEKKPPGIRHPLTRTIEALVHLQEEEAEEDVPASGVTVYHLSNSGQGPSIDIYRLPSNVMSFIWRAQKAKYRLAWKRVVARGWYRPGGRRRSGKDQLESGDDKAALAGFDDTTGQWRNAVYEDLFSLPEHAGRFLRRHFLPRRILALLGSQAEDGERPASYPIDSKHWGLVVLFLQEVVGMDKSRVSAIAALGDELAQEISDFDDARLFRSVATADGYRAVRNILIRADLARLKRGQPPVIGFDSFLKVFEEGEEVARVDWRLAWDLTVIRVLDALYQKGWFNRKGEVLETEEDLEG
jgi:CRISPR-associated protein Cst1